MSRLYLRLFVWFVAANLLTLILTAFISNRIARHVYEAMEPDWGMLAQLTAQRAGEGSSGPLRHWSDFLEFRGIDIALLDETGNLLRRRLPPPLQEHLGELRAADEVVLHPVPGVTLVGLAVERPGKPPLRFLAVRHPRPRDDRVMHYLMLQLLVSALVIAGIGWIIARSISTPVAALQAAARRVAEGALQTRVGDPHTRQRDELGQLARDFDRMAERIQALVEQSRELLQDVSHELRSPLARLQLAVELARRSCGEDALRHIDQAQREVARLDRLIGEVLALSRLEGQLPGAAFEPVALDRIAEEQLEALRESAGRRDIELHCETVPLQVTADRGLLERALDNLLGNAIKFAPPGSCVELQLRRHQDQAELAILDRGPGIPEAELERVFQPFFRGSNAAQAEGQGLGLAIVRRIAQTHGGEAKAETREGGGLVLSLRLPLSGKP